MRLAVQAPPCPDLRRARPGRLLRLVLRTPDPPTAAGSSNSHVPGPGVAVEAQFETLRKRSSPSCSLAAGVVDRRRRSAKRAFPRRGACGMLDRIAAPRTPAIRTVVDGNDVQPSLFDERERTGITALELLRRALGGVPQLRSVSTCFDMGAVRELPLWLRRRGGVCRVVSEGKVGPLRERGIRDDTLTGTTGCSRRHETSPTPARRRHLFARRSAGRTGSNLAERRASP